MQQFKDCSLKKVVWILLSLIITHFLNTPGIWDLLKSKLKNNIGKTTKVGGFVS